MLIHKLDIAAKLLPAQILVEDTLFDDFGVESHFRARDRVDEGSDDFEEGVDEEGEVDDDRFAEVFWVVGLEVVEDLQRIMNIELNKEKKTEEGERRGEEGSVYFYVRDSLCLIGRRTYCASDSDRRVLCSVGKVDHEV